MERSRALPALRQLHGEKRNCLPRLGLNSITAGQFRTDLGLLTEPAANTAIHAPLPPRNV
jgi:hypothetical protein